MLLVALKTGSVLRLELTKPEDARRWRTVGVAEISSVSLSDKGSRCDLPLPRWFRYVRFEADVVEKDGKIQRETVSAYFEKGVLRLTMYPNGSAARFRVDLDGRGARRFDPTSASRINGTGT